MSELATIEPASVVCLPGATLTRNSLIISPNVSNAQLAKIGAALVSIDGSRCWWIGDYGVALQNRKGEHYTEGQAEVLGIERGVFWNYKSVAAFFNPSCRHEALSFGHHYEAMCGSDGDVAVGQNWLDKAARGDGKKPWSVSELRKAIRSTKAEYKEDGLNPTGNGYSALLDADRWASIQIKEIATYTPERAAAILGDIGHIITLVDHLRTVAEQTTVGTKT